MATLGSPAKLYWPYLCKLMSYKDFDGDTSRYPPRTQAQFSPAQIATLTPEILYGWMCLMAYGTADPAPNAVPVNSRANTLCVMKKAISFFTPNRLMPWNAMADPPVGNPTKSILVNDLIKRIKKDEVRLVGKASQARRPMTTGEIRLILNLLEQSGNYDWVHRFSNMVRMQLSMIARGDDVTMLSLHGLKHHPKFDFALSQSVRWSKNVMEERDCPPQILMGSNDPDFCVQLGLAIYLEDFCGSGPASECDHLFVGVHGQEAAQRFKAKYQTALAKIMRTPEFIELSRQIEGLTGSHSIRKYSATQARAMACSADDVEIRGRWKSGGQRQRTVDTYIDVQHEFIDAKVCAALCVGGPVHYKLKDDCGVTREWLLANVVPGISAVFREDNHIARVLGPVLLYACLEPTLRRRVPQTILDRVDTAYAQIRRLDDGVNPVKKVFLTVYRISSEVR